MIEDIHEACQNMNYPGMTFDPEEVVNTFLDPSFKAWQAHTKGVQYADKNDLKEANTRRNVNLVKSNRTNKDAKQSVQQVIDALQPAQ